MEIMLLEAAKLGTLMRAIRTSHASLERLDTYLDALGYEDAKLLKRIIEQRHDSVLEHIVYTLVIKDVSRALLQELVRHRHTSFTVESTRFTLHKKLKKAFRKEDVKEIVDELCVVPPLEPEESEEFYTTIYSVLEKIHKLSDVPNDYIKYMLPECFKTQLVLTTNARELLHIITLRSSPYALWEFQRLAQTLANILLNKHPQLWEPLLKREGIELKVLEVEA